MDKKKRKEIMNVIQSKNFTLYYYDNGCCSLYKGRFSQKEIENFFNEDPEDKYLIYDFEHNDYDGYLPDIVSLLVKALNGSSHST